MMLVLLLLMEVVVEVGVVVVRSMVEAR